MGITITRASEDWNISRTTIYNKINSGKISKLENGRIDPAEMSRVFGQPKPKVEKRKYTSKNEQNLHPLTLEKMLIEQELQFKKQSEQDLKDKINEYKVRTERAERRAEEAERRADEREKALLNQITNLTETMKLLKAPSEQEQEEQPKQTEESNHKEPIKQNTKQEQEKPKKRRFGFLKIFD